MLKLILFILVINYFSNLNRKIIWLIFKLEEPAVGLWREWGGGGVNENTFT